MQSAGSPRPDFSKEFVLATDVSDVAVLAVLQQRVNGDLAHIGYYSRVLTSAEKRYSTYEKECLAILYGYEKCGPTSSVNSSSYSVTT
jgi:hypothetical protein